MKDAACWFRVSHDDGSQDSSNQIPDVERLIAQRELREVTSYTVSDSASNPGQEYRDALKAMLADAHAGKFSYLVVWAADRLSREGIEALLRIVRQLRESNVTLISVQEPWLNGSDATTELLLAISAWMAEQESKRRSERTKAGMARAKLAGKSIGGRKLGSKDLKPRKVRAT